ncbi:MAG: transglycosylase SLT domain-containing protein, partial [Gammaproteobacteria bacterium]|nr:transglycosylase SLT domain-containing protein [Gammaproteobacteria bacterium]
MKNLLHSIPSLSVLKPVFILASVTMLIACNETRSSQLDHSGVNDVTPLSTNAAMTEPRSNQDDGIEGISFEDLEFDKFEELYLNTESTVSIWPRIRAGFKLPDDVEHESLQNEIDWIARHPEYMQRVMRRADPFIYYILEEAEKRDLPTELVLLPIVESAYQPFAYSHGRAAGIWQFIPSTGKHYGLKQNWWYDG